MPNPVETTTSPQESKEGKGTQEVRTRVLLDELKMEAAKAGKNFSSEQETIVKEFLEKNKNFSLTKDERMALIDEITGIEDSQLVKIKEFLYRKDLVQYLTNKALNLHKTNVEASLKTRIEQLDVATPEALRSIIDELDESKITGSARYMALHWVFNRFFAQGDYVVEESGRIFPTGKITDKDGKKQEEFTKIWNDKITGKEWKNIRLFVEMATSTEGGNLQQRAENIAKKYKIDLKSEKSLLLTRIRTESGMSDTEKMILEGYLSGDFPKTMADEADKTRKGAEEAKKHYEAATGKPMNMDDLRNGLRNPGDFVTKFLGNMGPVGILATIGLIIGWVMDKEVFGAKSSVIMKILAATAGISAAKAGGLTDYIADLVEDKNNAREGWIWAGQELAGGTSEAIQRLSLWYGFSHFQMTGDMDGKTGKIRTVPIHLVEANFLNIHKKGVKNLIITRDDKKTPENKELDSFSEKMDILYKDGKTKYPSGTEFEDKVVNMSVKEVIAFVTDPVEKNKEPAQPTTPVVPVVAAVGTGAVVDATSTKNETAEEKLAREKAKEVKKEEQPKVKNRKKEVQKSGRIEDDEERVAPKSGRIEDDE